jgi:hypothetical protein
MADEHQDHGASEATPPRSEPAFLVGVSAHGSPARSPSVVQPFVFDEWGSAVRYPLGPNGPTGPTTQPLPQMGPTGGYDEEPSPDTFYSPEVRLETATAVHDTVEARDSVDAIVIPAVGRTVRSNRDAILIQSTSIQLLLTNAIEGAKAERANSASVPELEQILSAVEVLHHLILVTAPPEAIGEKAISFRQCVANWWTRDYASILDRSFDMGLFTAAVGICVLAGVVPAAIAAVIVRPTETVDVLVSDGRIAWIIGLHVRLNRRLDRRLGCQKFPPLVVSLLAFPGGA